MRVFTWLFAVKSKRRYIPATYSPRCFPRPPSTSVCRAHSTDIMPRRCQKQSNRYIIHDTGQSNRQCRIKRRGKGHRLPSQAKYIVESVRKFFNNEKTQQRSTLRNRAIERTAKACGVAVRTVHNIQNEFRSSAGILCTPEQRYTKSRVQIQLDDFNVEAIRRTVHEFYTRKEYPTLESLLATVKSRGIFSGGRTTLRLVLREMGFRYKRHENKRYIYEQPRMIQQRHDYLRRLRRNRQEKRPVIYLDEMWLNAHHGQNTMWVDGDGTAGWKRPSGKGGRLIVLHAGTVDGWVPGAELVFRAKSSSGDYHNEMNIQHFMEWWKIQLLPNSPPNSLIVIDNASYHNGVVDKIPTKSSRKLEMQTWLKNHGIPYSDTDLKMDLMAKITAAQPSAVYLTDVEAEAHGHECVRLPVAHCELNPIELAWANVKEYVRKHNKQFTMAEVERLTPTGISVTTQCHYTRPLEEVYTQNIAEEWKTSTGKEDGLIEETVEEFTIEFGVDSDNRDDSDEESGTSDDECDNIATQPLQSPTTPTRQIIPESRQLIRNLQADTEFMNDVAPLP